MSKAIRRLVELFIEAQGPLAPADLQQGGVPVSRIEQWVREGVLVPTPDGRYESDQLDGYIHGLVLIHWRFPTAIIGKLSALEYYGLSVYSPLFTDVCLPEQGPDALLVDRLGVRPFALPPALRDFGVTTVFPKPPGTVAVKMYCPEVALAQVLADDAVEEEAKRDAVWNLQHRHPDERLLVEALERYHVSLPVFAPR